MAASRPPSPDEARASLDEVADSRRMAIAVTRRPGWLDAVTAVGQGVGIGVAAIGGWPAVLAGLALLAIVALASGIVGRRYQRRGKRIFDDRTLGVHLAGYLPLNIIVVIGVAGYFRPGDGWQPWYSIGIGALVALAGFVLMRLEDRHQARRLAAGDYTRYDVL